MNNFDKDIKDFFNKKMYDIFPSEDLKNRIIKSVHEDNKYSLLDKIKDFLNKELEIPIVAMAACTILICILPLGFSVYYKEKIVPKAESIPRIEEQRIEGDFNNGK